MSDRKVHRAPPWRVPYEQFEELPDPIRDPRELRSDPSIREAEIKAFRARQSILSWWFRQENEEPECD